MISIVVTLTTKTTKYKKNAGKTARRNGFAAMENLRVQSFEEIELKESKTSSGWRVMNSQEKPMKIKIVYVQAIKIERANVKIHINYCYNSNLYALFTCFVFAHYRRPIIIIIPLQWTPKPVLIHCSACVCVCILC